ncbi:hypothetical protein M758_11G147400 [Ceratodon purpureus]|nr:hypothetical protein M758_11G147400 [Ceratodon purpureus]
MEPEIEPPVTQARILASHNELPPNAITHPLTNYTLNTPQRTQTLFPSPPSHKSPRPQFLHRISSDANEAPQNDDASTPSEESFKETHLSLLMQPTPQTLPHIPPAAKQPKTNPLLSLPLRSSLSTHLLHKKCSTILALACSLTCLRNDATLCSAPVYVTPPNPTKIPPSLPLSQLSQLSLTLTLTL